MDESIGDKVNIFIAFMLSGESQTKMQEVADDVKELFQPDGKDEKFFHCTLLFIGRVDKSFVPFIQEKMKEIAKSQQPIQITIDDIGYFYNPKKERVKVLYAKPSAIPEELEALCGRLYKSIGKPLQDKTTPPIQKARIHFTITKRLKRVLSIDDFERIRKGMKSFSIHATIDDIGLYFCKDAEYRYYREISKFEFPKAKI